MNSEKFLVFLISTALCAIGLLVTSVLSHEFFILGNMQLSWAMAAVFLSLILNGMIMVVNKTFSTVSVKDKLVTQLVICFVVILVSVIIISMFVQVIGLKLLNIWGGIAIALIVITIQFFASKYAYKILSKDF